MGLKTFRHGIHPPYNKELTAGNSVERIAVPTRVVIPLQQHIGATCKPVVKKGDSVVEGDKIGDATTFVTAPVHASISGKIKDIGPYPHPLGGKVFSIVIEGDGHVREWDMDISGLDIESMSPMQIKDAVRDGGIVGMGGASFPSHVKISPPKDKIIDAIILNGCECEPYLTSDHRLMLEFPEKVLCGMKAIMRAVGASRGYIGIEENKSDAIDILKKTAADILPTISVVPLETKYPQGAEKMLIKAVINRTVPAGRLPLDVGVVVNNVGTASAVYDKLAYGKPLIERIVTVSGNGLRKPKNLLVRIGTSFGEIIDACGGIIEDGASKEIISGGPMMGVSQTDLSVPIIKGTSGITVLSGVQRRFDYHACIKCASCVEACPVSLMPYRLGDLSRLGKIDLFGKWGGMNCVECGCCSFVCPSKRPLLPWIRVGKVQLRNLGKPGSK